MARNQGKSIVAQNFAINDNGVTPVWIQIKNRILHLIASGQLREGDQLPSMRQLSVELQVNLNTISKIYQDLQKDGFLVSQRGKGLYVANTDNANLTELRNANAALAEEFISRCLAGGMDASDVLELVRDTLLSMTDKTSL